VIKKSLLLVLVLFIGSIIVHAQEKTIKIGVIDAEKILRDSIEMQQVYKDIQALVDKKQNELKQNQDEITKLEDKYRTQSAVLSSETRAQLEEKIRKAYVEIEKFKEDSKIEIQTKENAALEEMEKKVGPIIQKIGAEENFTLILRKELVVYMNKTIDITDKVIEILNQDAMAKQKSDKPK